MEIATDDDPFLRIKAKEVDVSNISENAELQQLVKDMIATMYAANGIGLAAPQIRQSLRIIVFYLPAARDDVEHTGVPLTVLINPSITFLNDSTEEADSCTKVVDFEGCLSVPGMRGKVARAKRIRYTGVNEKGEAVDRVAEGWHARLLQHEYDHLEAILYTDLMAEEDSLLTVEEWRAQSLK